MPTTTLAVQGMTCGACSTAITAQLQQLPGVSAAAVSLITEEATVQHDATVTTTTPALLKETIEDCGFDAKVLTTDFVDLEANRPLETASEVIETRLKVTGMTCSNCSNAITKAIQPTHGVLKFDISLITEEAVIEHDPSISSSQLKEMVEDCGFDAEVLSSVPLGSTKEQQEQQEQILETLVGVKGMTCGACTSSVTNVLNGLDGVLSADVSLVMEQAKVKHHKSLKINLLTDAIEDCGFDATVISTLETDQSPLFETTVFDVSSVVDVDRLLTTTQGVVSLHMEGQGSLAIKYDSSVVGVRDLISAMNDLGIEATPENVVTVTSQMDSLNKLKEIQFWKWNFIKTSIIGLPLFIIHHFLPSFGVQITLHLFHGVYLESLIEFALGTYIQFTVGLFFWKNTKSAMKHGSGTMDTLVCISTNISYYFSILTMVASLIHNNTMMAPHTLFETAVLLMNFVSLGKWLESKAKAQTAASLSKLISLTSDGCTIVEDPTSFDLKSGATPRTINIPINYLQVRDILDIKPGEKIPADGVIIHGESEVDESLLTGESLPIVKRLNDKVIGGSINGIGHIFVKVTTTSENSQLSKIIKLVKSAQMNRAPIQSYADFIASIFVPTILILSLITFICWFIICNVSKTPLPMFQNDSNGKFFVCLKIAISVVVVACPCALGLAAPTAIMVGTGVGASNGIFIKGGDVLEAANDLDFILFDKTGTLTVGEMMVKRCHVFSEDLSSDEVLLLTGSLEAKSEHPIGRAIKEFSQRQVGLEHFMNCLVDQFEAKVGKGLSAIITYHGKEYDVQVGNLKMFTSELLENDPVFKTLKIDSDCTLAHVVINGKYEGYLELEDVIKEDSSQVIAYLKSEGYQVAMVTGDSQKVANKIASQVGIGLRNVYAEVSPYGKEQLVRDFQSHGLKIAFIGDGINDSPALASADVGVAISSGTDVALEAADIVLLNNEMKLNGVSSALSLCRRTLNKIKWNFFWSSVYNFTMVPLAMGVLIPWGIRMSPLAAGVSMAASSLSVVLSSLLLKRWSPPDITATGIDELDDSEIDLENGLMEPNKWSLTKSFKRMLNLGNTGSVDVELQDGLLQN